MSGKTGSHTCFLILSTLLTFSCPCVYGENSAAAEKVVSVLPDLAHGSITISTNSKTPLPAPLIQYLPGSDGKTLLVADFEGISYQLATHLLKPENSAPDAWRHPGIQEIRIGQFSSQPPTMRISVAAFNARAFRTLAFHARPGTLIMKWTAGYPVLAPRPQVADNQTNTTRLRSAAASSVPAPAGVAPLAPDYRKSAEVSSGVSSYGTAYGTKPGKEIIVKNNKKPVTASIIRADRSPDGISEKSAERLSEKITRPAKQAELQYEKEKWLAIAEDTALVSGKKRDRKTNSDRVSEISRDDSSVLYKSTSASSNTSSSTWQDLRDDGQVIVSVNDIDQINDDGATDVLVKTDKKLDYKTFRLHEPERYVIDFDGLPALASAQLPAVNDELLVKGMRTGTPDQTGLTNRLVLDLKDSTVDVCDQLIENGTTLSLKIRRSSSSPMPTHLKAQLVKNKLIVLDAGHGGSDPGAQRSGVSEKDLTMQITNQLKKRLTQLGARVIMTRSDDTFVSLEDRVKITNDNQPDLFLSIHINALESTTSIYGVETYYQTEQSRALATAIHQQLVQGLGVPDRSVRKARFYVINHTPIPAILAEVGFISNPQERDNLGSAGYQVKIADSVSQGIVQYLTEKQELAGKSGSPSF
ncbi:MAG: N-acetylmuramoyl-L-alanine amidase [Candidatus Melainabacteria bacterium]|nr:N-acetylmuramoyl-L-alanine amidase [Candidatus Melainabacteria bacterium]